MDVRHALAMLNYVHMYDPDASTPMTHKISQDISISFNDIQRLDISNESKWIHMIFPYAVLSRKPEPSSLLSHICRAPWQAPPPGAPVKKAMKELMSEIHGPALHTTGAGQLNAHSLKYLQIVSNSYLISSKSLSL